MSSPHETSTTTSGSNSSSPASSSQPSPSSSRPGSISFSEPANPSPSIPKGKTTKWLVGLKTGKNKEPEKWLFTVERRPRAEKRPSLRTATSY
ncbi:hypothetical protein BU26DRAFT_572258 [Trematosphaeria pertusa]|uniref:Uncharacterized protein n=1 Tax=Trematosphaeria pertusa TaxID=390896 RepID=A0A6A6HTB5_9PLEO|nr:uncharacterized protein BU26DRAFT_572258 [Trematosphaeria pertusa]KAF2241022.1 hypothetical protein BU26DRAFT_572258 [Trematosphaeria pertusa]